MDAEWLIRVLESWVAEGRRFAAGEMVQVGWSLLQIESRDDGLLRFLEPDFKSMPVSWVPGVTSSLAHLRFQKDAVASVLPDDALDIPSLRQSCIVCNQLSGGPDFLMSRAAPEENDSGWFIGCLDESHDHNSIESVEVVSLHQAVVELAPGAVQYLGLPVGCGALVRAGEIAISNESGPLEVKAGSYLDRLSRRS